MLRLRISGLLDGLEREYRFHPDRRWRLDFAWPARSVGVEIQGGGRRGRHTRMTGYRNDCLKLSTAASIGWLILPMTPDLSDSDAGIELLEATLEHRRFTRR